MKWTGLTGGIATGKSTAKKLIESLGIPVVDADQISHKLSEVGAAGYTQIVSHFGHSILNSDLTINRKKLGKIIFSDSSLKLKLESILHPLVQTEVRVQRETHRLNGAKLCFYDVPLLFEKKLWSDFDATVLMSSAVFFVLLSSISAAPTSVCFTNVSAISAFMPNFVAASIIC